MLNPFTFCLSEDAQLLSTEIRFLIKKEFSKECSFEKKIYWGTEELPSIFWDDIQTSSFFTNPKIIIIRKTNELRPALWKTLSKTLSKLQQNCILFFFLECKTVPKHIKDSPCYQHAYAKKWLIEKAKLTKQSSSIFIQTYIHSKSFQIERRMAEYLAQIFPQDAYAIITELDKLMLYSISSRIDKTVIEEALSYRHEHTIWNLLEAIQHNKSLVPLWSTIDNISFFLFSSVLQKELRIYLQFILGDTPTLPPFIYKQKEKIASILNITSIQTLFATLSETEYKIKTGHMTEKQALEYILITSQKIFSAT